MVKFQDAGLDRVFGALSHSARRSTLEALVDGARSVSDLAAPHGMSLAAFMKHVRVLEEASLIACEKEGRVVHCVLAPERIREAATWLARYERFWDARLDASAGTFASLHVRQRRNTRSERRVQRGRAESQARLHVGVEECAPAGITGHRDL